MFDYLIATILSALSHTASFVGIDMPKEDATAQHVEREGEDAFTFGIGSRGEDGAVRGEGRMAGDVRGATVPTDEDMVDPTLERDILRALDEVDGGPAAGVRTDVRGLALRDDDERGWDDEGDMDDEAWDDRDDRGGEDDDEYDDRGSRGVPPVAVPVPKPVATPAPKPVVTLPTPKPTVSAGITLATLAQHASATDCWVGYNGTAYDITKIISWHPGGPGAISPYCGTTAEFTNAFARKHGTRMVSIMLSMATNKGALAQ